MPRKGAPALPPPRGTSVPNFGARVFCGFKYSALFSQRYGVEKLLGGVKDLLLPGILLGMLDHQEE